MQIKQKRIGKKTLFSAIIVLLAIIGGSYYLYYSSNAKQGDTEQSRQQEEATSEEKDAGQQAKDETVEENGFKKPESSNPPSSNSYQNIPIQISASSQNGSIYQIRVLINSVVPESACTLSLEMGSKRIVKTSVTQALAQTSTCKGFDIPISELLPGTWKMNVNISGNSQGSVAGEIEVK